MENSFAEIKRRIQPGTVLVCVENTYRTGLDGTKRHVIKVQGNGFYSNMEGDNRRFWTAYPPAKNVKLIDVDTFQFPITDTTHVTLRFA